MKKRNLFFSFLGFTTLFIFGFLGFTIYNLVVSNSNTSKIIQPVETSDVKGILKAKVNENFKNFYPSDINPRFLNLNNLSLFLEPNSEIDELRTNYEIEMKILPEGINDHDGTLQIKITTKENFNQQKEDYNVITVFGFKAIRDVSLEQKNILVHGINMFNEIELKNNITADQLNHNNFWNSIVLPQNIVKHSNLLEKVEYYTLKGFENQLRFNATIEKYEGKIFAKIELFYINNPQAGIINIVELNDIKDLDWTESLDNDFKNNVLPSHLFYLSQENLQKFFLKNFNPNIILKVVNFSPNDSNGTVILEKQDLQKNTLGYKKFILANNQSILDNALASDKNKIANFLENDLNLKNNANQILQQYNFEDAFNYRYTRLIRQIKIADQKRNNYLENTLKIYDSYKIFDLFDWKLSPDKKTLNFRFVNESNQEDNLSYTFKNKAIDFVNFNPQHFLPRKIADLKNEIHLRSMAISYFEKKETDPDRVYIISGTAWVIDKSKHEKNTYYIATNSHVVERLQSHWENITGFAYSLYNNKPYLDNGQFSNIFNASHNFRIFSKNTKWAKPLEKTKINSDKPFWDNFEIFDIGANTPLQGFASDIAIIRMTFPDDEKIGAITIRKNIPDAANYYSKMQQNPATKLKFFNSRNQYSWDSKSFTLNNMHSYSENVLPTDLVFGGYLSGQFWRTNDGSGFLKYSLNNEIREINQWDHVTDPEKRVKKLNFGTPYQISMPMAKAGTGMSGSMVMDRYGRVIGIFWGGLFPSESKELSGITKGVANIDPIGISYDNRKTILQKWLDLTKNIETDLDDSANEINFITESV
ncbi:DUF31 family protein [Mycoplasma iguanae]|uniref:DUF31 family protein n=1 Tax=Mycoplasma iguanae TaxID=292461 RepID=A0ABY5R7V6_9MOLU|nr:DUF31 family protein [Mycoplasma iguanae]UVD81539.1 DUF31 family protein [Mycoplasma iguanae]